jgi:DNA polymerase (family X)
MAAAERNLRRALAGLKRIVPAGDFRRGCELVCDLSLVAEDAKLEDGPELVKTNQLSVYLTGPEHFGSNLLLATGSNAHLQQLRTLAEDQGLSLTERGLRCGDKSIAAKTEAGIYKALGLQYIEPELREGRNEIAREQASHSQAGRTQGPPRNSTRPHGPIGWRQFARGDGRSDTQARL